MSEEYHGEHVAEGRGPLGNETYDRLKFVAQILLPALAALYAAVGVYWGLPKVEEVVGTIAAVDLFLGTLLGLSSAKYKAQEEITKAEKTVGELKITETADKKLFSLDLDKDPEVIEGKDEVIFKVNRDSG